jgi:hypothetical protein
MNKLLRITLIVSIVFIAGCAASPIVKNMEPELPLKLKKANVGLGVDDVEGGAEQFAKRYKSFMHDDMHGPVFKTAIVNTLSSSNMFASVTPGLNNKYILKPEIVFQNTSVGRVGSASFTYALDAKYTILEKESNRVVYSDQFTSACVKTMQDSFGGPPRYRMAIECAVRDNLSQFIVDLSSKLDDIEINN